MLFSEIYGSYFNVVTAVIAEAVNGNLTDRRLTELVNEKAFLESMLSIPSSLKKGSWPLLRKDMTTVIRHTPTMPLTLLQKRWLKALLQDPRITLFSPDTSGLEDIEPLYNPETFVFFDQYTDGDPYNDETYIENFKTILQAIREKRKLRIRFHGQSGIRHSYICIPYRFEYSAKDDKFRLITVAHGKQNTRTINLARVRSCTLMDPFSSEDQALPQGNICELTLHLHDERNGLERVLLHFSHFDKETVRLDDSLYEMKLRYDKEDETELLIRVLSFGPVLEVIAPDAFVGLIKERLAKQSMLNVRQKIQIETSIERSTINGAY